MTEPKIELPSHIQSTIETIAGLHSEHHSRATALQRFTESLTAAAGRSAFVAWLTVAIGGWVLINLLLVLFGQAPVDPPPFAWLEIAVSLAAFYTTVLILSTQRRDDELSNHREQLALQHAILSDQKAAKIIELLERLRQDHPSIEDRIDHQAREMATPADAKAMSDAIKSSHDPSGVKPTISSDGDGASIS